VKRSEKNDYVTSLKEDFKNSSSVIVTNYSGLSVKETEELRRAMRKNGVKFKITKNTLTKLALANTKNEVIADLFKGPTAIAYSSDSLIPAKITSDFEKKFANLKIIGGAYEGEKIGEEKIQFLASLPSLDELRGRLIGLLNAPAQQIVSVISAPASQLVQLINKKSKKLEKAN